MTTSLAPAPAATALVADDEPHLARALQQLLGELWPTLDVIAVARHGVEAASLIAQHQPDIAFLDIQMPGLTGLEVAEAIEGTTRVVFVTAYDSYAVQAFEREAIDYVLKPVTRDRLQQTVARLQRLHDDDGPGLARVVRQLAAPAASAERLRWIRAGSGDLMHQVPVEDVLYFHADDKYTTVITAQGEHLIRTPIAELVQQLDPAVFWQIHRSTIVNLAHLAGTRRDDNSRLFVRIRAHGRELPVSRAYVHRFKAM